MKKTTLIILGGLLALSLSSLTSACPECWWESFSTPDMTKNNKLWPDNMPSMRRHQYVMNKGIPENYRFMIQPAPLSGGDLENGKQLFEKHCVSCHGDRGRGDGIEAFFLNPRPADLKHMSLIMTMTTTGYIYWTIAEGGKPIKSDMPAYKSLLTNSEIWHLIHYIEQKI